LVVSQILILRNLNTGSIKIVCICLFQFATEKSFTTSEVAAVICQLKCRKEAGEDKIRPEMLKAFNIEIFWLTRVVRLHGSLSNDSCFVSA